MSELSFRMQGAATAVQKARAALLAAREKSFDYQRTCGDDSFSYAEMNRRVFACKVAENELWNVEEEDRIRRGVHGKRASTSCNGARRKLVTPMSAPKVKYEPMVLNQAEKDFFAETARRQQICNEVCSLKAACTVMHRMDENICMLLKERVERNR